MKTVTLIAFICLSISLKAKPIGKDPLIPPANPDYTTILDTWDIANIYRIPQTSPLFQNRLQIRYWIQTTQDSYDSRYHQLRKLLSSVYLYEQAPKVSQTTMAHYPVTSGEEAWIEMNLKPDIVSGQIVDAEAIESKLAQLEYVGHWLRLFDSDYIKLDKGPNFTASDSRYGQDYISNLKAQHYEQQYQTVMDKLENWEQIGLEVKLHELKEFAELQFNEYPIVSWIAPFLSGFRQNASETLIGRFLALDRNWAKPSYYWTLFGMQLYIENNCNDKPEYINMAYMTKWAWDPRSANTTGWFEAYLNFMVKTHYESETGLKLDLGDLFNLTEEPDLPICCFAELDGSLQCLDYGELCNGDMCPIPPV